jgi:hypothetical protein
MKWRGTYQDNKYHRFGRNFAATLMIYSGANAMPSVALLVLYGQFLCLFLVLSAIERRMGNG